MIEFSNEQKRALAGAERWLDDADAQTFKVFGFAGTGKTTVANTLGDIEMNRGGYVQYCAFTGKAAMVMRQKGCVNARTLHSLIYQVGDKPRDKLDELEEELRLTEPDNMHRIEELKAAIEVEKVELKTPIFAVKNADDGIWVDVPMEHSKTPGVRWRSDRDDPEVQIPQRKVTLFAVDECSMVGNIVAKDLLSFNTKVLLLGDPAQLPPVRDTGFFSEGAPNHMLTEIHRQARGNPIIDLATRVREGKAIEEGQYGTSRVCGKNELTADEWMAADQILVGRNASRVAYNKRYRIKLGYEGILPVPGERLICLRNNRDIGLLNGSMWEVVDNVEDRPDDLMFSATLQSIDEPHRKPLTVFIHKHTFLGWDAPTLPWERKRAQEFDFGYAITVHKSQGSQWDNVILVDEWNSRDRRQWLYTGITRAAKTITVVR